MVYFNYVSKDPISWFRVNIAVELIRPLDLLLDIS